MEVRVICAVLIKSFIFKYKYQIMKYLLTVLTLIGSLLHTMAADDGGLYFIENNGQITNQTGQAVQEIDFKVVCGKGLNIFIGSKGLHYQFYKQKPTEDTTELHFDMYRVDVSLVDANTQAELIADNASEYYEHHTNANKSIKAYGYKKLTYKNVYPNIDWVLHISKGQLKHNFIIHPGGKVSDIKLKYDGVEELTVNADGSLLATSPLGNITESAPVSFQEDETPISSKYIVENNVLSYDVAAYEGTLTIDPVLEWARSHISAQFTYSLWDVEMDSKNNFYICGETVGIGNLITSGAHQTVVKGAYDVCIIKTDDAGNIIWATYFGDTQTDRCFAAAIDSNDNLFITGETRSLSGMSTAGAHQTTAHGTRIAFVSKFSSTGNLVWSTYLGRGLFNVGWGIYVDKNTQDILVCGSTESDTLISTTGTHQPVLVTQSDGFIVRFDNNGVRKWGTYFGGNGTDAIWAIASDRDGDIYAFGNTISTTNISTASAHQIKNGGNSDTYLGKFTKDGVLIWSTYYGGQRFEYGRFLAVDNNKNVYISGWTTSTIQIATSGTHLPKAPRAENVFIAKIDSFGYRAWGTYFGGDSTEYLHSMVLSKDNKKLYISGSTNSDSGFTTKYAHQEKKEGQYDAFIAELDESGSFTWGTYYAIKNNRSEFARIALDSYGNIYMAGSSDSSGASTDMLAKFCVGLDDINYAVIDRTATVGSISSFTANFTVLGKSFQWQADTGTGFFNLVNGATYKDVNTHILKIDTVSFALDSTKYRCIINSGACVDTTDFGVLYVIPNSVNDITQSPAYIYPNPTDGRIHISSKTAVTHVELTNMVGKKLYTATPNSKQLDVDISHLPSGVYLLKLNGQYIHKVLKE